MLAPLRNLAQRLRRPRRSLLAALFLAAIGFGGYHLAAGYWTTHAYHDHLEAARKARRAGQLDAAAGHLAECARLRPASPEIPFEQALLHAQAGDVSDGDLLVNSGLAADQTEVVLVRQALTRHAVLAMERGDFLMAYKQIALCLRLAPTDDSVQLLAARCCRRAQNYQRAQEHLAVCQQLTGPTPALQLEQLLMEIQQGHLRKEDESYLQSLVDQDHPESLLILEALTQGYMCNSQFKLALICIEKWTARKPKAVQAYRWRATIWKRLRRYEDALRDYRKALELDPRHDPTRLALAEMLMTFNLRPEAQPLLEEVYQRQPNDAKVLMGLAVCRYQEGRFPEAAELLARLPEEENQHVLVLLLRGRVAIALGKMADAERYMRQAVKMAPRNPEVQYTLFRALQGRDDRGAQQALTVWKRLDKADVELRELRKQIAARPHDLDQRCRIGELCLQTGKDEEGVEWLEGVVNEDPNHRAAHEALADYYTEVGQPDRAAKHRQLARQGVTPKR